MTSTSNITKLSQDRIRNYMDYVLGCAECDIRYFSGEGSVMVFNISDDVEMRLIGDAAGLARRCGTDLRLDISGGKKRLIVPLKKRKGVA